ncbi:AMED_5909 family protein [Amycolatopsis panacis]|nr:AMED_5909 family protein [Amycolatopsis panacis]
MTTKTDPTTLREAHDSAMKRRPAADAGTATWLTFHRENARMYRAVADTDRWHHHEATYWANREDAEAERLASLSPEESPKRK